MGLLELVRNHKIAEAKKEGYAENAKCLLENGFTVHQVSGLREMELPAVKKLADEMKTTPIS